MTTLFFNEAQFTDTPNAAQISRVYTTETYATITASGWATTLAKEGFVLSPKNKYLISYNSGASVDFFNLTVSNGSYTFTIASSDVILPVVSGDFAIFSGTSGAIADLGFSPSDATKTKVVMAGSAVQVGYIAHFVDVNGTIDDTAAAVTNPGNIYAGLSGTAGVFRSYPSAATSGYLGLTGVANSGDFAVQISNASHGQATVYSFADIGASTGGIPVATAPFKMKQVAQAAVAGGAAAQTVTDAFCTSASNVIAVWNDTTNAVDIQKVAAGNGSFVVTSSGDPGASHINYIIMK